MKYSLQKRPRHTVTPQSCLLSRNVAAAQRISSVPATGNKLLQVSFCKKKHFFLLSFQKPLRKLQSCELRARWSLSSASLPNTISPFGGHRCSDRLQPQQLSLNQTPQPSPPVPDCLLHACALNAGDVWGAARLPLAPGTNQTVQNKHALSRRSCVWTRVSRGAGLDYDLYCILMADCKRGMSDL